MTYNDSGGGRGTDSPTAAASSTSTATKQTTQPQPQPTAGHRQARHLLAGCLTYGRDWPGSDAWTDRDGAVYFGDGPFLNRPWRRLRRWWTR